MEDRLPIRTQHCQFCNHLLLATTRNLSTLPQRSGESKDKAIILPIEKQETTDSSNQHTTLLLSTLIPDRRHTLIRREDGFEKRLALRCGRCRVIVGYHLDDVHYEGQEQELKEKPVYLLPGAVIETEKMGQEEGEWRGWIIDG